jgi:ATP phosphoribosyltransferase
MLTIALSKGRIFQETLPLLQGAGIECKENPETSRKLILNTNNKNIRLLIVRASDVPTYVECGGADIGIAGKDVLDEFDSANLYQICDLKIAKCKMMVAGPKSYDYQKAMQQKSRLKVATKYTKITKEFFAQKGIHIDVIKLYGSMELAPLVSMSDLIVDLVSSGQTLKANNLVDYEKISDISSQLIVNKASLKLKFDEIQPIINTIKNSVK